MVRNKNKTKLLSKKSKSLGKRSARAITPEEVNKLITSVCYNYASGNRDRAPGRSEQKASKRLNPGRGTLRLTIKPGIARPPWRAPMKNQLKKPLINNINIDLCLFASSGEHPHWLFYWKLTNQLLSKNSFFHFNFKIILKLFQIFKKKIKKNLDFSHNMLLPHTYNKIKIYKYITYSPLL